MCSFLLRMSIDSVRSQFMLFMLSFCLLAYILIKFTRILFSSKLPSRLCEFRSTPRASNLRSQFEEQNSARNFTYRAARGSDLPERFNFPTVISKISKQNSIVQDSPALQLARGSRRAARIEWTSRGISRSAISSLPPLHRVSSLLDHEDIPTREREKN